LVVNLGTSKQSTPIISKNLNPEWKICFDMPLVGVPLVECICWDRDRWGKDYMGEFDLAVEDIFANGKPQQEVYILSPIYKAIAANTRSSRNGTSSGQKEAEVRRRQRYLARSSYSSRSSIRPMPRPAQKISTRSFGQ
jgi:phosphatidylserine decarboxylase